MTEILSRQELNALLSDRGANDAAPPHVVEAQPFSFAGPVPFSSETLSRMSGAGERFASSMKERLGSELRREVTVSLTRIEIVTGQEVDRLLSGGARLLFDAAGLTVAEIVLDPEAAMALVEARLGGGAGEPQPRRALTPIETRLIARLMTICGAPPVLSSFPSVVGGSSKTGPSAGLPSDPKPAAPLLECRPAESEPAMPGGVASVLVQVSVEGRGGMAALLLPASRASECGAVEESPRKTNGGRPIPVATLLALPLRAVPRIPGGAISLRDLMALRPGHVVRLDHNAESPIELLCNKSAVVSGRLIRARTVTSLEIVEWIDQQPANEARR